MAGGAVTWLSLVPLHGRVETCLETLDRIEPLIARGGIPQVTAHTSRLQLNLRNPSLMASLKSWNPLFNKTAEEQERIYRDPGFRNAFREEMRRPQIFTSDWSRVDVDLVANPALKGWRKRRWPKSAVRGAAIRSTPFSTSPWKTTSPPGFRSV